MTERVRQSRKAPAFTRSDWLGLLVFGAAAVSALAWLTSLSRGLTFFYDEWDFVNAAATTSYWHQVLQAHNGHPSMVPYTVYEALLRTVGLTHYWPFQLVLDLLDITCGWLVFVLLRRKVHPVAAAAGAAVLMLLGPAWQDLLWPFQIGFLGSVAAGLGALVLLDQGSRRADVGACVLLIVSVGCSGVGLPFVAGVGIELLWQRPQWLQLWVPVVPLILFVGWNAKYGDSSVSTASAGSTLHTSASATATTVGAMIGRGTTVGAVVAVVLGVLVILALARSPGGAARLAMAVTGLLSFWVLTVLARGGGQGSQSRYLYPAATLAFVAVGELPALIARNPPRHQRSNPPSWIPVVAWLAIAGIVAYAGLAIWWNASSLDSGASGLAENSAVVRAELGAVVLAGPALPSAYRPDTFTMPQVSVGPFLRAVAAFGTPGDSQRDLENQPRTLLSALDAMLLRGRSLMVSETGTPSSDAANQCQQRPLGTVDPTVNITLVPKGSVVVTPGNVVLTVRTRSLSTVFSPQPIAIVTPGSTRLVRWSAHPTHLTWYVQFALLPNSAPGSSSVTVCTVSGGGQRANADMLKS